VEDTYRQGAHVALNRKQATFTISITTTTTSTTGSITHGHGHGKYEPLSLINLLVVHVALFGEHEETGHGIRSGREQEHQRNFRRAIRERGRQIEGWRLHKRAVQVARNESLTRPGDIKCALRPWGFKGGKWALTHPHGGHQLVRTESLDDDQEVHVVHRVVRSRQLQLVGIARIVEVVPGIRMDLHHLGQVLEAIRVKGGGN